MAIEEIYKRDGSVVPFDKERTMRAIYKAAAEIGKKDQKLARRLADKVIDILENHFPKTVPTVEDVGDIVEQVLIEQGHGNIAKAYIIYRQKRKDLREKKEKDQVETIPYQTIWKTLVWNLDHQCETVDKLNTYVDNKTLPELITASEDAYSEELARITADISKRINEIKLLIICGPSSSGKTTTAKRLRRLLEQQKIGFIRLDIDNYYYNLKVHLKDPYGDYDFEGPYALDLPLINQHLADLVQCKTVNVPRYDFKTGKREKKTDELRRKKGQIILIDSLFGIYDKVTESVKQNQKYKVYLETLCQLRDKNSDFVRWTDVRMLRRMIRDTQFRSYDPMKTVGHWHYVRHGELKNIIPYIDQADYIFDTSLAYELPILKFYLFKYFPKIIKAYQKDSHRQDAYMRAQRVYALLEQVHGWNNDSVVPKNSILREFIG
ncbi:ATP cone domain-containing protein [Patescibacteria group bacterium AH-259-L07]|nr:ATP cone domain-containing protein [Patescibacteria group bacterium AH-259-L07]